MFTTDSGFGWNANPARLSTIVANGRKITLTGRGVERLAELTAAGASVDDAAMQVMYHGADRDMGFAVVGWWVWIGRKNPWKTCGRLQICRTVEHGEVHYTATSMITDHSSKTLADLLSRISRMQAGYSSREGRKARRETGKRIRQRAYSQGEVWARRAEEGWGPGGY